MPLVALRRFRSSVSKKYFYTLGVKSATFALYTLFISLFFICIISYPIVFSTSSTSSITTLNSDSTTDAQLWLNSPHLHSSSSSSSSFLVKQIRITSTDNNSNNNSSPLSKNVLSTSLSIYQALTVSNRLRDICALTTHRQCLVHSPLALWDYSQNRIQEDSDPISTVNQHIKEVSKTTGLPYHPYATMANITMDSSNGNFISASSIILTFILKRTNESQAIWDSLWQNTIQQFPLSAHAQLQDTYQLEFKLKFLPAALSPIKLWTIVFFGMGLFIAIKRQFSTSNLLKSASGLGVTALFLSCACYTVTLGIFHYFRLTVHVEPWFLPLLVCSAVSIEHVLVIASAVISREKAISVKERVGKGMQQVGITMLVKLMGEIIILCIGSRLSSASVKSFCQFTFLALIVAYVLNMTLFLAVLSIDIRRAELADLGNEEYRKDGSLHCQAHTHNSYNRRFKTKRAFNAFLLCIIILLLNTFGTKTCPSQHRLSKADIARQDQLDSISNGFWRTLNPDYSVETLQVDAPYIVVVSSDVSAVQHISLLRAHYTKTFATVNELMQKRSHYYSILDNLHPYYLLAYSTNLPSLILLFMMACILMWMTPYVRENYLLPFLRKAFVRVATQFLRILSVLTHIKTDAWIRKVENEYNEDGMHMGAISLRSQFNKRQNQNSVRNVTIKTLVGMHVADLRALKAGNRWIGSIGQNGKVVLWDKYKGEWVARLDKLKKWEGETSWIAERAYDPRLRQQQQIKSETRQLSRARCIHIDEDTRCAVVGFDQGWIRVWDLVTAELLHEVNPSTDNTGAYHLGNRVLHVATIHPVGGDYHIVSAHRNGQLREWDIKTGEVVLCFDSGHRYEINTVHLFKDNQGSYYMITACRGGITKCWKRKGDAPSSWTCLYTLPNHHNASDMVHTTSVTTQQLRNDMGILVTGSSDGAVKVWNLSSGAAICTLSQGGIVKKESHNTAEVGGPLLQFSTVARSSEDLPATDKCHYARSDHSDAVIQVAATRIGNPEFENDTCPICNTVINSGFFVASCGMDSSVHVWRLTVAVGKDIGCSRCARDYHRKQSYTRFSASNTAAANANTTSTNASNTGASSSSTTTTTAAATTTLRPKQRKKHAAGGRFPLSGDESESNEVEPPLLTPLFLGKLNQRAGHGLVFCKNMVLGGVRHVDETTIAARNDGNDNDNDEDACPWEAWFTSLQYYEPPDEEDASSIPVVTFNLEKDDLEDEPAPLDEPAATRQTTSLKDQFLLTVFGIKKVRAANRPNARKNAKTESGAKKQPQQPTVSSVSSNQDDHPDDDNEYDDDDAFDLLPFSTIRHIVPTDGCGLSCDYGNFIKVVSYQEPYGNDD